MKRKLKEAFIKIKSNDFWRKLFKNSFYAIMGEGGSSVINLFVVFLLIKLLGNDKYAILVLAQSYMSILDLIINLQSWQSVIKFGEEMRVKNKIDRYLEYIKLGTILDVSTALLCGIISFFITPLVGSLFNWSRELIVCCQIFTAEIYFHFSGTPIAVLRLENKFNLVALQKIISAAIKLITLLVIVFMTSKMSLIVAVIIYVATDIISHLILVVMFFSVVHRKWGIKKLFKSKIPQNKGEFIKYTIWCTLGDTVDIPVLYLDVFVVSALKLELVTVFKVFKQIMSILSKLASPIYQAIFPQFSTLVAKGEFKRGYDAVIRIRNAVYKYFIPLIILVGLSSPIWLKVIFGELFSQYWYVLFIYLIVHTYALSYTTIHPYFTALGKVKEGFIICLIANIVYLGLALLLTKHIGMIAIVISYTVQILIVILTKKKIIKKEIDSNDV